MKNWPEHKFSFVSMDSETHPQSDSTSSSLSLKHSQVDQWLRRVYGSEKIPSYEIKEHTVDLLYELMMTNMRKDKHAEILTAEYLHKVNEYRADRDRLAVIVERLGLTGSGMSRAGRANLNSLVALASMLHLSDTSDTSFLLALSELRQKSMSVKTRLMSVSRWHDKQQSKTQAALERYRTLTEAMDNITAQRKMEEASLVKKEMQTSFLQCKSTKYKEQITILKKDAAFVNYNPSTSHQDLVKKSEELEKLRQKLDSVKLKVDSYHCLPPDPALARVKVEESKRELKCLEEELAKHIDLMHA